MMSNSHQKIKFLNNRPYIGLGHISVIIEEIIFMEQKYHATTRMKERKKETLFDPQMYTIHHISDTKLNINKQYTLSFPKVQYYHFLKSKN